MVTCCFVIVVVVVVTFLTHVLDVGVFAVYPPAASLVAKVHGEQCFAPRLLVDPLLSLFPIKHAECSGSTTQGLTIDVPATIKRYYNGLKTYPRRS